MPSIATQLKSIAYRLLLLRLVGWLALCLIGMGLAFGGLEILERLLVFKEGTAFILNILIIVSTAVICIWGLIKILRNQPKLSDLSNKIEQLHPELMDSLNAVVDIVRIPPSQRGPIEKLLVGSVEEKTCGYELEKMLIPWRLRVSSLSGIWLIALTLLVFAHFFDASKKFRYQFADWILGESTGFYVAPKPMEIARNEDLEVFVTPRRWDQQCTIHFMQEGKKVEFPMNASGDNRSGFVFYDVVEDFQFRIETQALTSPWHSVIAYDPPVIDLFQLSVDPPVYSGVQPEYHDELKDLEFLEGTLLSFDLAGESIDKLEVQIGGGSLELQKGDTKTFGFDIRPDENSPLRFVMYNDTGHRAQTETVEYTVLPDESPVVEWIEPGEDITVKPKDVVPLELFVADDFGLDAVILNLSISGTRQTSIALYEPDPSSVLGPIEINLFETLDLFEMEVLDGDVISYSATAMDNKQPKPNLVRSEVFFIEVRVEKEPIKLEGMDGEREAQEVDVRALVIELKRLIRDTYAALGLPPDENRFANQEIGADLASLRDVIETVMVQAAPILTQQGQEHLMEFLIRAREAMERAETMINSNATDLAIAPEEQALAELVSFEAELSRNETNSESQSQSQSQGQSQGEQTPEDGEQNQGEQEPPSFAELPQALDDLNSLIDRQNEMNQEIERAERRKANEEELAELAEQQSQLFQDAVEMRDQLERIMPGTPAASAVDQAAEEMASGAGQLEDGNPSMAQGSGQRAQESLMNAATLLEQGINQMASQMMEGLASQGQQLAQLQRQAAQQSRQADSGELNQEEQSELKEQQQSIAEAFEEWQDQIGQTANQLREQFPEAAFGLDRIQEQAEEENVEGQMSRAENALHYRRFGRAAPIQDELAKTLDVLAEGIEESAFKMPQLADAAVRRALAELQEARETLQELQAEGETPEGQKRLQAMEGEMSGLLSDLASRLEDPELREFAVELNLEEDSNNWAGSIRATDQVIGNAGQVLLDRLRASLRDLQLDMLRQSSDPPEQYRGQVEKYFEQLSEEGSGSS